MSDLLKKGRGRPKKDNLDNKPNFDEIKQDGMNQNQSYNKSIDTDDDSDLKEYLKDKKDMSSPVIEDIDKAVLQELEGIEDEIKDDNKYNPLEDAVEDRGYTKGIVSNSPVSERIIDEPIYTSTNAVRPDVDEKLLNPNNLNQNNQYQNNTNTQNQPNNNSGQSNNLGQSSNSAQSNNSNTNSGLTSSNEEKGGNEKKLTPKEQRDAAEKTAEIALLAYKNYIPLPFIYFGKINIKKLRESEKKGELDLQTPVDRKGTRFIDRVNKFNEGVEHSFDVSDEEIEALREPLVDVLMEKEVALTPTQRLIFVAGQFVVAKIINVVKLVSEQREFISEMKEMHREKMESERLNREVVTNKVRKPKQKEEVDEVDEVDDYEEDKIYVKNNSVNNSSDDIAEKTAKKDISKAETVNYTEVPTLEDAMNMKNEDDFLNDDDEEDDIDKDEDDDNDIPD